MLKDAPHLGIDQLADEILKSKIAERAGARSVCWDCDDLVFLDFDTLRIALHDIPATEDAPNIICLGIGPVPGKTLPMHFDTGKFANGLVKRVTQIMSANAVFWYEDPRELCTFVMDDFHEELAKMLSYLEEQLHGLADSEGAPAPEYAPTPQGAHAADEKPAMKRSCALKDEAALQNLRTHLRRKGFIGSPISKPIHVSIYLLACSFLIMTPAVGGALLSYALLRDGLDKPSRLA